MVLNMVVDFEKIAENVRTEYGIIERCDNGKMHIECKNESVERLNAIEKTLKAFGLKMFVNPCFISFVDCVTLRTIYTTDRTSF